MSDENLRRDREIELIRDKIGKGYVEQARQARAKLKEEYLKDYNHEMEEAVYAYAKGDLSAATLHQLKASIANNSLKALEKL